MKAATKTATFALLARVFDPLEEGMRPRCGFVEAILEEELRAARGGAVMSAPAQAC
ncbi:MAG: hypothetical protein ACXW3G_04490 [Rhodoplanes sp.]